MLSRLHLQFIVPLLLQQQSLSDNQMRSILFVAFFSLSISGCAVVAVADAAVTVVATTVKVGAVVVGTTVDVAAAGVRAVAGSDEEKEN